MITCKYYVYLLKSEVANRYYCGKTINIKRRLLQHNGEIAGGAKKTSKHRPWKYVLYVSGFLYERTALQFEFCIQKYRKIVPSAKGKPGLEKWVYIMHTLLNREKICSTAIPNKENRYIIFFHDKKALEYWNKLVALETK